MDRTSTDSTNAFLSRFTADERAYLLARVFLVGALSVLYALGFTRGDSPFDRALYLVAFAVFAVVTVVLLGCAFVARMKVSRAMLLVVVPDLCMFAIFTYLGKPADSFYPVMVVAPVLYALVVSRRAAIAVGAGSFVAYVAGTIPAVPQTVSATALFGLKAVVIPAAGYLVANAVAEQRFRERSAETAATATGSLNAQLRRRVHELQAISDINEIIHSSFEFDRVGPQVLDIMAQAVGIDTCHVFVVDKDRSETLFSAGRGAASLDGDPTLDLAQAQSDDQSLACESIFDRGRVMVLFCAPVEDLAQLTEDERVVLNTMASELVTAAENSRLYKLAARLAITDELTGLANYRHLQQRLDEEMARAERYDKQLSLLMLDVDDFKAFNDRYGHVAGDGALAQLGQVIRDRVRGVDLVARYGGEEFSVILPETDASGAFIVAEKIREAVELHDFSIAETPDRRLTLSIGLATYPTHGLDKDSVLREADDALYHAKNSGRNRVRVPRQRRVTSQLAADSPGSAR